MKVLQNTVRKTHNGLLNLLVTLAYVDLHFRGEKVFDFFQIRLNLNGALPVKDPLMVLYRR